jgi:hypothetical protein
MQMINEHMNVLERMNIVEKEVQWNLKKLLITLLLWNDRVDENLNDR